MRIDRRGFLRVLGGTLALASRSRAAAAEPRAPEIHSATANRRFGAAGARRPRRSSRLPDFKDYPGAAPLALPRAWSGPQRALADAVASGAAAEGFSGAPIALVQLARLLHCANGVTGAYGEGEAAIALRAAPSAGALYAGELYVAAERVEGLAPGLYYYAVAPHALLRLREGAFEAAIARALERPRALAGAAACVLLTNVFARYTWRYANRGYRYALIDSGHIGENLRLAALSAGLGEALALRFHDDALAELLGIDGREEAVCALHALGVVQAGASAPAERRFAERQDLPGAALSQSEHLTERYHEATKLVPVGEGVAPPAAEAAPAPRLASGAGAPPGLPGRSVEDAIARRRSPLEGFRADPISAEALRFVAAAAHGHAALARAPDVDLYLVAHRVEGLPPGLHRFDAQRGELLPLRRGALAGDLVRACGGQEMAGQAAAAFVMAARFAPARTRLGDRRYRDQLVEAGAIGERVYLAAEALDLAARNLAAFRDDRLDALLGLDSRRAGAVHLTVIGRET
jgi:SagB-type dehydrogenase family enzyme